MLKKAELFREKIDFIFRKISNSNLDEFTKLFYIEGGKTTFENRRYNLKKNWLGKATLSKTFSKEYGFYPFSLKNINGKKLFTDAEEFFDIELESFKERILEYVDYKNTIVIPNNLEYKYLYTFSCNGVEENQNIDYYEIKYLNCNSNKIDIEVTPPKNKKSLKIETYEGVLELRKNKIILTFSNSQDYISAIFNSELANRHTKYLVGVIIGIADFNEKIPVAKKVVLTKKIIDDLDELYLALNETEFLLANENSYKFKDNDKKFLSTHLEKYIQKITKVNEVFKKLSKKEYFPSFYEQLAFKEFLATQNLFLKLQKQQSFYIHYRKRILDVIIDTYKNQPYKKLSIVMPIYEDDNIFEQQSDSTIELQTKLKELSKHVDIEIVFVLKRCTKVFKQEFETFLKEMSLILKINFVFKDKVQYDVNSIDFFFTDRNDFVISKLLRNNITVFQFYKHKNSIDEYHAYFRKILNRSFSYKEFIEDRSKICEKSNPLLETLSGEWYHYVYGSKTFLEDRVKIFKNGKVEYYSKTYHTDKGIIINKAFQSVILLDDPITKRLFTIVFDHQPYQIQKAFFTKNIAKQFEKNLDIFAIGILSRKKIPIEKAKDILGDINNVQYLENHMMADRLSDYLIEQSIICNPLP